MSAAVEIDRDLHERLDLLFRAVAITSPTTFVFGNGAPVTVASTDAMADALWPFLYSAGYVRDARLGPPQPPAATVPDPSFVARVSAAHATVTRWEANWRVYQLGPAGALHLNKGDTYLLAQPGRYASAYAGLRPIAVGESVDLLVVREAGDLQQGFHFLFGQTVSSEFDDVEIARFYFNCESAGVAAIVGKLTDKLNRFKVPFRLKFLTDPQHYERSDPFVLYVSRRYLAVTQSVIATTLDSYESFLRPSVPLFSKAVAEGIGAADDPGSGESFGQSRCMLVARAIVDAWRAGLQTVDGRRRALERAFELAGLSLERPHVAPHAVDFYGLPPSWGT